jgi:hypothetical protein
MDDIMAYSPASMIHGKSRWPREKGKRHFCWRRHRTEGVNHTAARDVTLAPFKARA